MDKLILKAPEMVNYRQKLGWGGPQSSANFIIFIQRKKYIESSLLKTYRKVSYKTEGGWVT